MPFTTKNFKIINKYAMLAIEGNIIESIAYFLCEKRQTFYIKLPIFSFHVAKPPISRCKIFTADFL